MHKATIKIMLELIGRGIEAEKAYAISEKAVEGFCKDAPEAKNKAELIIGFVNSHPSIIDLIIDSYKEEVEMKKAEDDEVYRVFTIATKDLTSSPEKIFTELAQGVKYGVKINKEQYEKVKDESVDPITEAVVNLDRFAKHGKKFGISERKIGVVRK